jgi:hypothetical protein
MVELALWMLRQCPMRPEVLLAIALATGVAGTPRVASGLRLSIGLVGGAAVTDGFRTETVPESGDYFIGTRFFSTSKDYIAGASIEMRFTPHWSIEADGMFRELHLTWAAVGLNARDTTAGSSQLRFGERKEPCVSGWGLRLGGP